MNYLTAIIAFPIFVPLFLFELFIYVRATSSRYPMTLHLTRAYLAVSFFQATSVVFWLAGYIASTLDSVYSEGFGDGERCNCFGLVGAEVLLSIFQWIMTCTTAWQALLVRGISSNKMSTGHVSTRSGWFKAFCAFCAVMAGYMVLSWVTYVLLCLDHRGYLEWFQHHPYPVWLIVDMALYSLIVRRLRDLRREVEANLTTIHVESANELAPPPAAESPSLAPASRGMVQSSSGHITPLVIPAVSVSSGGVAAVKRSLSSLAPSKRSKRKGPTVKEVQLRRTVRTFTYAFTVTMVSGVTGSIFFFLQYIVSIPAFSVIACVYCLFMYVGYMARRTPFIIIWCGFSLPCLNGVNRLEPASTMAASVSSFELPRSGSALAHHGLLNATSPDTPRQHLMQGSPTAPSIAVEDLGTVKRTMSLNDSPAQSFEFHTSVTFPVFNILLLFELWMFWKAPPINNTLNRELSRAYLAVSVIQTVSVWFWFLGFVFSKVNNVFGEGFAPGEECNCFGLVGAEVVLSIYQWIMTCSTAWQALSISRISMSKDASGKSRRGGIWSLGYYVFCGILACYTGLCWVTAHNRRCPQGEKYLFAFQHYFYPVFLVIDMVLYGLTARKLLQLRKRLEASNVRPDGAGNKSMHIGLAPAPGNGTNNIPLSGSNSQISSSNGETGNSTPALPSAQSGSMSATNSLSVKNVMTPSQGPRKSQAVRNMRETVRTYTLAFTVTLVTGLIGVAVFFLQFVANIPQFSLIACIYCLLMYIGYVARRTPFLIMWCKYDLPPWMRRRNTILVAAPPGSSNNTSAMPLKGNGSTLMLSVPTASAAISRSSSNLSPA
ncbi:hypothetical protein H9P43_007557 [Blastocladiella emersonii ATCC 22665]|nr:hypothetical protein H9P43_007557 [Blastocladiella emersonii ATCC 22665]